MNLNAQGKVILPSSIKQWGISLNVRFGDLQNITSILCRRRKGTDNKTKQTPKTNKTSDYEVEKRIEYI